MEIYNICGQTSTKPEFLHHPARVLFAGPSGCGKTNNMAVVVLDYFDWDKIYMISKHLDEKPYTDMIERFEKINNKVRRKTKDNSYSCYFASSNFDDVPDVTDLDKNIKNLVIIDDFVNEKHQEQVEKLFMSGRHANCSVFYLSQSYHATPAKIIRKNCSYYVLYKVSQGGSELTELAKQLACEIDPKEFKRLFKVITAKPYGFMVIDRCETDPTFMRYRMGWDTFIDFEEPDDEEVDN